MAFPDDHDPQSAPTLPLEIMEAICLYSKNAFAPIAIRSIYLTKRLLSTRNSTHVPLLLSKLGGSRNTAELVWLAKTGLLMPMQILQIVMTNDDSSAYLHRIALCIGLVQRNYPFEDVWKYALMKGRLKVVQMLFVKYHWRPRLPLPLDLLKRQDDIFQYVIVTLPTSAIRSQEGLLDAVIECDDLDVINALEVGHAWPIRDMIGSREITLAGQRGALTFLRWYHNIKCNCSSNPLLACIYDDTLYTAALRNLQMPVIRFLELETTAMAHRRYHDRFLHFYDFGTRLYFRI